MARVSPCHLSAFGRKFRGLASIVGSANIEPIWHVRRRLGNVRFLPILAIDSPSLKAWEAAEAAACPDWRRCAFAKGGLMNQSGCDENQKYNRMIGESGNLCYKLTTRRIKPRAG